MSGSKTPKTDKKAARPVGPRTLYIIFPHGTPAEVIEAVQQADITFNGRLFLQNLQGGNPKPFAMRKVAVAERGEKV